MSDNENVEAPVVLEKSESAPAAPAAPAAPVTVAEPARPARFAAIRGRGDMIVSAAAALFAVVALTLGICWHSAAGDLNALRAGNSDRDRAAEIATDYATRSLTYDYKNLPAFFDGVQRDTSQPLRDKFTQTHDALTKIMTGAQVTATGKVMGTSVESKGNDQYAVTVYALQRTQSIQQTDPATKPNLLLVTVAKNGGDWLVVDFGPKDGLSTDGVAKDAAKDGAAK
ncbi:hypothetical protein ACFVUS_01940 [Nocardia sp. NPDC058058]|uniref:hypothetical protein n=1 Tax=Nocardia sp. NPDC058058 TaxID=3346317 RepID=UPI0036D7C1D0